MLTIRHQRVEPLGIAIFAGVGAVAAGAGLTSPGLLPWALALAAGAALLVYWAVRWEITLWAWVWVLSYGLLDWPSWKINSTAFFNMTVPRFLFLALLAAFAVHFLVSSQRLRFDRAVLWVMLAALVYFTASAAAHGWTADVPPPWRGAPYFRLLGAMVFPFTIFLLVSSATREEQQIPKALILLSLYGWYALYIAYLQYAAIMGAEGARSLIWPSYINDPGFGHHFDRARGAFPACNPQANVLILIFFGDLLLIRRLGRRVRTVTKRGAGGLGNPLYRAALIVQVLLIPPAIFFTGLRSGYLAFLLCGAIWLVGARRERGPGRLGGVKLAVALLALVLLAAVFWPNLMQTDRATGGIAQTVPLLPRIVLAQRTWELLQTHPLTGVGFGHYLDAARYLPTDPGGLAAVPGVLGPRVTPGNLFLVILAETGLVGFVLVVAIFALLLRESIRLYRKVNGRPPPGLRHADTTPGGTAGGPEAPAAAGRIPGRASTGRGGFLCREFVVLFWVAMAAYLTDAMFVDPFWDVPSNGLFWTMAGLMCGCNRLLESPRGIRGPK